MPNGPGLYYERGGQGEPLLFITGFLITAAVFEPVRSLYEEHFDVITYDSRWAGRSPSPPRLTSMPELAADAVALLDALDVESAHVYGVSFGGMIAQELAIRFPDRVRGLILGGTTPGGPRAVLPNAREFAGILARAAIDFPREPAPWLSAALFSREFRREHPGRAQELAWYFVRYMPRFLLRPWGIAAHWWASFYHDTVSRLGEIQAPTLVMQGSEDGMAPLGLGHMLAERIPDAELVQVQGAGHAYPLEQPEESLRLLLEWMQPRSPIEAGACRDGLAAQLEPLTRILGLHAGALRTGRSLTRLVADRVLGGGDRHEETNS